ncbi:MAG: GSCFA domain-containing protein [Hyphomicrobium aestuarii]|nr:GSCFA domain-containing protein [Hyphomicrobium aestuarii]
MSRNFGVFSARYGNIYTPRQLLQLFQRSYGMFEPSDRSWRGPNGRLVCPFRPQVEPDGFSSTTALHADNEKHEEAVRRVFEESDVFIFTLGLTEGWLSQADGAVVPLAPGVAGQPVSDVEYQFHNFTVVEMIDDMRKFITMLRTVNSHVCIILTVSPVPLIATYEKRHVLVSTIYSKSALRVVAEIVSSEFPFISYFPSYEIVTGHHHAYSFFEPDLRSIKPQGVQHVMSLFKKHYLGAAASVARDVAAPKISLRPAELASGMPEELFNVVCDEEVLDQ